MGQKERDGREAGRRLEFVGLDEGGRKAVSSDGHPLRDWFDIAVDALRAEDAFLRKCLQRYGTGAYAEWSPGIRCLYETGIVYLVLRALWSAEYPRAVGWEYPYPGWRAKVDLAVFHQRPDESVAGRVPAHVVEVKRKWVGRNAQEQRGVWWDLLRLLWFREAEHRYLLLLTFGPASSNLAEDVQDVLAMKLGQAGRALVCKELIEAVITEEVYIKTKWGCSGNAQGALWEC